MDACPRRGDGRRRDVARQHDAAAAHRARGLRFWLAFTDDPHLRRPSTAPDTPYEAIRRLEEQVAVAPFSTTATFLGALYERAPELQVEVTRVRTDAHLRGLCAGQLDFGVVHGAGGEAGIETEPLFAGERLAAHLPVGHPLGDRETLGPEELRTEILLVVPRVADPALGTRLAALLAAGGYRFGGVREAPAHRVIRAPPLGASCSSTGRRPPTSRRRTRQSGPVASRNRRPYGVRHPSASRRR